MSRGHAGNYGSCHLPLIRDCRCHRARSARRLIASNSCSGSQSPPVLVGLCRPHPPFLYYRVAVIWRGGSCARPMAANAQRAIRPRSRHSSSVGLNRPRGGNLPRGRSRAQFAGWQRRSWHNTEHAHRELDASCGAPIGQLDLRRQIVVRLGCLDGWLQGG